MSEKLAEVERHGSAENTGLARQVMLWAMALLFAWGMAYYYWGVLLPLRKNALQVSSGSAGAWSDLYHEWFAARELLQHGRNPYSSEVTEEIERGFYGADRYNAKEFGYPQAFTYPVYVVFMFAPFLHLSFETVRVMFTAFFFVLMTASVPLWVRALKLDLGRSTTLLILLFALSSYPVVDGLVLEQLTMLVAGLLAVSLAAMANGNLRVAGILLAFSTVKPHLVILLIGFLVLWTFGAWQERKQFAIAFSGTMAVILIASELALPGWFHSWLQATHAYIGYVKPSLLEGVLGKTGGAIVGGVSILFLLGVFWRVRGTEFGSPKFNLSVVAALVLTVILVPAAGAAKYNQVLLIPAVMWLLFSDRRLRQRTSTRRVTWFLAVAVLAGEWILAFPVSLAVFALHRSFQREATFFVAGPELLIYVFPLALGLFVLSSVPQVLAGLCAQLQ